MAPSPRYPPTPTQVTWDQLKRKSMVFGRFEMLHTTPNGKVPVKEKEKWTIPLCIINSENADDYVVPLKNRLAAGGRGLPEVHILDGMYAYLARSEDIADRKAREAVELHTQVQEKLQLAQ